MKSMLKKLEWKHKNNKFLYYLKVLTRELLPKGPFQSNLDKRLASISAFDIAYIKERVNYYNKLSKTTPLSETTSSLAELKIPKRQRVYYFDTTEFTRYFNQNLKFKFVFGDVTTVPNEPSIIKSRPLTADNTNSIVLKLDKVRHFMFAKDRKDFLSKKNMLIWRGVVKREHRKRFMEMYFNHPLCNIGQINTGMNEHWIKERLTIDYHLDFKFILCIEGNDVATNLKWVMSSNSLAVMPKPKFETWFMEGTLKPDYHYVLIKDDFSDLEERMNYYINHPDEALEIVKNAHAYVDQFKDTKREELISLRVLEKYFYRTGQREPGDVSLYS
jgi:hypothetical protein